MLLNSLAWWRLKNKENDGLSTTQKSVYTTDTKKANSNILYERLYKLKAKEVRSRVEEPIKKEYQTKYLMKPHHLAQESGYSLLEDSH